MVLFIYFFYPSRTKDFCSAHFIVLAIKTLPALWSWLRYHLSHMDGQCYHVWGSGGLSLSLAVGLVCDTFNFQADPYLLWNGIPCVGFHFNCPIMNSCLLVD